MISTIEKYFKTLLAVADLPSPIPPNWVCIDCRFYLANTDQGRSEYEEGHIPGAFYAHLDNDLSGEIIPGTTGRHPLPLEDHFLEIVGSWGIQTDTQVLIYDQGHGGIAARLWWMLNWIGHDSVAVLNGGWPAYLESKRPIEQEIPARSEQVYAGKCDPSMILTRGEVKRRLEDDSEFILIDARDAVRHQGIMEPIDPIAGHIAGSINRPFKENLDQEGSAWKTREELENRWSEFLTQEASMIASYCGSGVTACHNILSIRHAGGPLTKLYPGSWSEWITQETD